MHTTDDDEARRKAVVDEARRRLNTPGQVLMILAGAQLVAALAVYGAGVSDGVLAVRLSAILLLLPAPFLLAGGLLLRRVGGFNLAFFGLLSSTALWALAIVAMLYNGFGQVPGFYLPLVAIAVAFAGAIVLAQLGEQAHVRAARSILRPIDPDAERIRGPI